MDYDVSAMLNVCPAQELWRRLETKSPGFTKLGTETTKRRAERTALTQQLAALGARLSRLEDALDDCQARTARAQGYSIDEFSRQSQESPAVSTDPGSSL